MAGANFLSSILGSINREEEGGKGASKREEKAKDVENEKRVLVDTEEQVRWRLRELDRLVLESPREKILKAQNDLRSAASLRLVILLHRHGDRTPTEFEAGDPLANEPFWSYHGPGSLTNRGKARMYLLGELIRARYATFLGAELSKQQVISRSSGLGRCIESAQLFLAGLMGRTSWWSSSSQVDVGASKEAACLPASQFGSSWDSEVALASLWQPMAFSSLARQYDGLLSSLSICAKSNRELLKMNRHESMEQIRSDFAKELAILPPIKQADYPLVLHLALHDDYISAVSDYFPDKLAPKLEQIRDRVNQASSRALLALPLGNEIIRRLRSGLILNELLDQMEPILAGSNIGGQTTTRLVHLSTQDAQLIWLIATLGLADQEAALRRRPAYGASLAFELHEHRDEGGWFVKAVYFDGVPGKQVELQLTPNDHPNLGCPLERFKQMLEPNRVRGWRHWMKECENSLDTFDPYPAARQRAPGMFD